MLTHPSSFGLLRSPVLSAAVLLAVCAALCCHADTPKEPIPKGDAPSLRPEWNRRVKGSISIASGQKKIAVGEPLCVGVQYEMKKHEQGMAWLEPPEPQHRFIPAAISVDRCIYGIIPVGGTTHPFSQIYPNGWWDQSAESVPYEWGLSGSFIINPAREDFILGNEPGEKFKGWAFPVKGTYRVFPQYSDDFIDVEVTDEGAKEFAQLSWDGAYSFRQAYSELTTGWFSLLSYYGGVHRGAMVSHISPDEPDAAATRARIQQEYLDTLKPMADHWDALGAFVKDHPALPQAPWVELMILNKDRIDQVLAFRKADEAARGEARKRVEEMDRRFGAFISRHKGRPIARLATMHRIESWKAIGEHLKAKEMMEAFLATLEGQPIQANYLLWWKIADSRLYPDLKVREGHIIMVPSQWNHPDYGKAKPANDPAKDPTQSK